ncbi:MAG TPA: hypothetical protein EYN79_03120 [Planctomycetes bacterium]|nr:hypothetical protein [Planctomycetota bacterium]HIN80661.1 hypothetical protein [Planctomycetota bacterium]
MRCRVNRTALVSLLLFFPVSASADVIWLQNGHRIEGRVNGEDAHSVTLELPEGTLRIPRDQIELIEVTGGLESLLDLARKRLATGGAVSVLRFLREEYRKERTDGPLLDLFRKTLAIRCNELLDAGSGEIARPLFQELAALPGGTSDFFSLRNRLAWRSAGLARRQRDVREAILSKDPRRAASALDDLIRNYPTELPLWSTELVSTAILAASACLDDGDLDSARSHFEKAIAHDPSAIEKTREALVLCTVLGTCGALPPQKALILAPRIAEARDLMPEEPALLIAESRVHEALGDLRRSANIWWQLRETVGGPVDSGKLIEDLRRRAILALAGIGEEPFDQGEEQPDQRRSEHFLVEGGDGTTVRKLLPHLEHHLRQIALELFGEGTHPLDGSRVRVKIHASPEKLAEQFRDDGPSDARLEVVRRYGIVVSETLHLAEGAPALESVGAPRELARMMISRWIGPGLRLPAWIEEGLCGHLSSRVQELADGEVLRQAASLGVKFSVAELIVAAAADGNETEKRRWKAASSSLVGFVEQRLSTAEMHRFIKIAAIEGETSALSEVLGFDSLSELQRRWTLWCQGQPGGSDGSTSSVD